MQILIFTETETNRFAYIVSFLFQDLLGFKSVQFTSNPADFQNSEIGIKLNYSRTFMKGIPFLYADGFLLERSIKKQALHWGIYKEVPVAFWHGISDSFLNFDPFSFSFYLLSRYEEYLPFEADEHGRFRASNSLAYEKGFLKFPLVDRIGEWLWDGLYSFYNLGSRNITWSFSPTYDIDYVYAFKGKAWWLRIASLIKNLQRMDWETCIKQWENFGARKKDPFDNFEYMFSLDKKYNLKPRYFFLMGDYGRFDKSISYKNLDFQKIIKEVSSRHPIALHPSYRSNEDFECLKMELLRLENISGLKILSSRQHYLRLHLPKTYRDLVDLGIEADYSMAYADQTGYRASTGHPFYWYDLRQEKGTKLKIHPSIMMDVTYKNYMNLDEIAVYENVAHFKKQYEMYGGKWLSIWHNNSFCEAWGWEGWRVIYENILGIIQNPSIRT